MTDWESHSTYLADALRELKDDHDRWLFDGVIVAVAGTRIDIARRKAALVLDNYAEALASSKSEAAEGGEDG